MFARADLITPPNANELALKENNIVAVTVKLDPRNSTEVDSRMEVEGEWWEDYMREGHEGWFPNELTCWRGARQRSRRRLISLPMYTRSHCIFVPWKRPTLFTIPHTFNEVKCHRTAAHTLPVNITSVVQVTTQQPLTFGVARIVHRAGQMSQC